METQIMFNSTIIVLTSFSVFIFFLLKYIDKQNKKNTELLISNATRIISKLQEERKMDKDLLKLAKYLKNEIDMAKEEILERLDEQDEDEELEEDEDFEEFETETEEENENEQDFFDMEAQKEKYKGKRAEIPKQESESEKPKKGLFKKKK